jgi:hypothetical protein
VGQFSYQRLLEEVLRRSQLEEEARAQREQWEQENERIRGRHVTPKSERPKCGARCRDGTRCQAPAVWDRERDRPRNGRCRMHGGLSTGPRTEEGKRRSREGARLGGRRSAERRRVGGGQ